MNEQKIFDTICNHLMKQKERSYVGCMCLYKSEKGLKCAVGCLISDEDYDPIFERKSVKKLIDMYVLPDRLHKLFINHMNLLHDLQNIHDNTTPDMWVNSLKRLSLQYDLKRPNSILE